MPILDKNNDEMIRKYNNFVENTQHGRYMQHISWSNVKTNWENDYVYLEDDKGNIIAALSILSIKNDGVNSFMYAARGPVCDINDVELVKKLIDEAKPIVEKNKGFLLRIDPEAKYSEELYNKYKEHGIFIRTSENPSEEGFSNPPYNMIFTLDGVTEENFMDFIYSKLRNIIRKTYKVGLKTRIIDVNSEDYERALEDLYQLILETTERNDIGHRPKSYLDTILRSFPDIKIFETFTEDGIVLSSSVVLTFNKKTYYLYSGSSNELRNLNASYQMNYEAILYAISRGSNSYDFGGIFGLDNSCSLFAFKNKFCRKDGYTRYIGQLEIIYDKELYDDFINNFDRRIDNGWTSRFL